MATVFVSHSSLDGAVVDEVAALLKNEGGHSVFLDRHPDDGIRVGDQWEEVLYDRLKAADAVVCIVTQHHVDSQWCFAEVALSKALGHVLLPLSAETGVRHPLLDPVQSLDYVADAKATGAALLDRLRMVEAGGGTAWDRSRPLFPGLAAFDTSDAPVFFGREAETEQLASTLRGLTARREGRGVVVVGASGSGKSSLVRAGLIPKLIGEGWWVAPPMLPGPDPIASLTFSLARAWRELRPQLQIDLAELKQRIVDDLDMVATELLLAAPQSRQDLLLVVDQFEETFTRGTSSAGETFLSLLDRASEPGRRTAVVATMRSEYVTELLRAENAERLRSHQFPLAPMSRQNLEAVIRGPASKGGLQITDELVRALVEDTGWGDALPLLAYVLQRMTDGVAPGGALDIGRYRDIGGVQGAIRVRADDALARASTSANVSEEAIVDAMVGLVTIDSAGRRTRRTITRASLAPDLPVALDVFVEARLVSAGETDGVAELRVSHESLFSAWPRLADAISRTQDQLQLRRRLEQAAIDWNVENRESSMLWRGEQLRQAQAAVTAVGGWTDDDLEFVRASSAAETDRLGREADRLAARVRSSRIVDDESELALLLLLHAVDELGATPSVIGGLRHTLARHRLRGRIEPPDAMMTVLAISTDGKSVAAGDIGTNPYVRPSTRPQPLPPQAEARVTVWDAESGEERHSIWLPGRRITDLIVSGEPAECQVIIDKRIVRIDLTTGERTEVELEDEQDPSAPRHTPRLPRSDPRNDTWPESFTAWGWSSPPRHTLADWTAAARRAAVSDSFGIGFFGLKPLDTPMVIGNIPYHGAPSFVRWRTDGSRVAITADGRILDVDSGSTTGPHGRVAAVSADARRLLLTDPVRLFAQDTETLVEIDVCGFRAAGFSGDGSRLAVASWGVLSVFDAVTGDLLAELGRHYDEAGDTYSGVALSQDGSRLVSMSLGGGRAFVWDTSSGESLDRVPREPMDHSAEGPVVASAFLPVLDHLSRGVELQLARDYTLAIAPDGSSLLLQRNDATEEYVLPEGHCVFVDARPTTACAYSPDGDQIILGRNDLTISVSPSRDPSAVIQRARDRVFRPLGEGELDPYNR